jgi:RNA polymerase sigma-70 factor (ECF subfamily)
LTILETQGPQLYALLSRLTLRADIAEDLLQDLFLKLHNSPRFHAADNFEAYVFRTAIHLAFDWRRRRQTSEPMPQEPAVAGRDPIERLIDTEELEQVVNALQFLSKTTRECLILRYLQHHEYAEIAGQIGKTEHQVRGLCGKGLGKLRTILGAVGSRPGQSGK